MSNKKILVDGCSFTANSGFTLENQRSYHWPHLLGKHYQIKFDNNAIGGSSNEEIFNRVICSSVSVLYDLIVVQWSEISRLWIHYAAQNIDDFTIINAGHPLGHRADSPEVKQYAKLHYTHFDNVFVNLKKWLCKVLSLAGYFDAKKQPYVFIKGFENYISVFKTIEYDQGFKNLDPRIKVFLDFDNRPDDYLHKKINDIQVLLGQVQKLNWINFDSLSFNNSRVDVADDLSHPGPNTNRLLVDQLIRYCNSNNLLTDD